MEKKTCTSITVSDADRAFLMGLNPEPSTLQVTLNIMLVKLVTKLKESGFTAYDPERYAETVNGLGMVLPGEPKAEPAPRRKVAA